MTARPKLSKHMAWRPLATLATIAALAVLQSVALSAEEPPAEPHELRFSTERLVVFKDGYALVVKRGTATADDEGRVYTRDVPDAAVLGSFWAVPAEGRLVSMIAGWDEETTTVKKDVPAMQPIEILEANVGKTARVELNDKTVLSGTIGKVLVSETTTGLTAERREALELSSLIAARADRSPGGGTAPSVTMTGVTGSLFVLATENGDVLVPAGQVRTLTIPDMRTTVERTVKTKARTKRLTFRFDEPGGRRELVVMYFRPGVRWIPTYRVELGEREKSPRATMALQGEILNEAEDFSATPIHLVVGVPNFRFREIVSPLVLEQTLRHALRQAAPQLMGPGTMMSNSLFTQRRSEHRQRGRQPAGQDGGSLELPDELTAGGTQDLFVYRLPKLALKDGERAAVPIFTAEVPYEDVYTWTPRLTRSDIETAPSGSGVRSPLNLSENQVWHQVVLPNRTKVPWTTGAAMILEDGLPLAQELLTYTSAGDEVRLPVTVAVDVRGTVDERELSRDLDALEWNRNRYAKIEKQATLRLRNSKDEAITAEITFRFGGKATEASNDGRITLGAYDAADWQNYRGDPAVNNSSTVRWTVRLKPGETIEPTVTYHYFTRQ